MTIAMNFNVICWWLHTHTIQYCCILETQQLQVLHHDRRRQTAEAEHALKRSARWNLDAQMNTWETLSPTVWLGGHGSAAVHCWERAMTSRCFCLSPEWLQPFKETPRDVVWRRFSYPWITGFSNPIVVLVDSTPAYFVTSALAEVARRHPDAGSILVHWFELNLGDPWSQEW